MPTLPPFRSGQLINGRYRIERPLGEGGMGAVYLATDTELERPVALKVPFLDTQDDQILARFKREARIAASLVHPNICAIYDFGVANGQPYLVMQLIEGVSLSQRTGPDKLWRAKEAVELVHMLALTMAMVHQKGPLHRDLKPSNIMLCLHGPVIMDFGLARNLTETTQLTRTGFSPGGSPGYMSLEQFQGDAARIGPAADVYSLGVIFYELLTGVRPLIASSLPELCMKLINEQPVAPSARRVGLDARLDPICLKALARDTRDRYPTMTAFAADLKNWLNTVQSTDSLSFPPLPSVKGTIPVPPTQSVGVFVPPRHQRLPVVVAGVLVLLVAAGWWGVSKVGGDADALRRTRKTQIAQPQPENDTNVPRPPPDKPVDKPNANAALPRLDEPPAPAATEKDKAVAPKVEERPPTPRQKKAPPPALKAPFTAAEARASQEAWSRYLSIPVVQTSPNGIKLVLLPPGEFQMGSPADEEGRSNNELQHRVRLTQPFQVGATEVTQGEYQRLLQRNPSHFHGDANPVENVTWFDAVVFCNRLSEEEGLRPCYRITNSMREDDGSLTSSDFTPLPDGTGYRLLTEAEWEYACRAGTTTPFAFGEILLPAQANFGDSNLKQTRPVGSYLPNAFGLYDMHGNVWEWCADWWTTYNGDRVDPTGSATGSARADRGGGWENAAGVCRSADRYGYVPRARYNDLGFRLARGPLSEGDKPPLASRKSPDSTQMEKLNAKAPALKAEERPPAPLPKRQAPPALLAPFTAAEARVGQAAWARYLNLPVVQMSPKGIKLVLVPPGEFQMGSPPEQEYQIRTRQARPSPTTSTEVQHRVKLTQPFQVGATEVTQAEFQRLMQRNPSGFQANTNPVERVTWFDAVVCCNLLSEEEGLRPCYRIASLNEEKDGQITSAKVTVLPDGTGYRLLTEAEWEYACRAGTTTPFTYGDTLTPAQANFDESKVGQTRPVASYPANAFGLYDMHGNVSEWCADWYSPYQGDAVDPRGPDTGSFRVYRGGGLNVSSWFCRSVYRIWDSPGYRNADLGFRLARGPLGKDK